MRIPSQSFPSTLTDRLQLLTQQQAKLQEQVSSGQRIKKASDDPAAMGRVLNLQAENQQLQQFAVNNARATDISQSTFSALKGLKSVSDRAGEISVLGSGTAGPDDFNAYRAETDQLLEQGLQAANTQFGGEYLFGGTASDAPPFTATRDAGGNITGVTYSGALVGAAFRVSEGRTISPFTDGATNQKIADFLNHLVALRDGLKAQDGTAVQASRANLNASEDDLLVSVSNVGATQTRLEADAAQNDARSTEIEKLTSRETSTDLTSAVVQLTQSQAQYQAALQSGAKIMQMSILDYVR